MWALWWIERGERATPLWLSTLHTSMSGMAWQIVAGSFGFVLCLVLLMALIAVLIVRVMRP